ncbi:ATP-binding protein [Methanospirillum sp.]|uniref:ATP-binding protein n=1 Tax=Methanospirillum sp. TaxID=45200 RepID=UPI0035A09969
MPKIIPYGIMNYAEIITKNAYLIDKTSYIKNLDNIQNPVFLRPRRFGKSLLCSMLEHYFDINHGDNFQELFGQTWIGTNPTKNHNTYIILKYDFSVIPISDNLSEIEQNFNRYCVGKLNQIRNYYPQFFQSFPVILPDENISTALALWLDNLKQSGLPRVYVIIDEYDNFVNQLITGNKDHLYEEITSGDSFFRTFFKVLKEGRQTGAVANVFITGVLPITIDDLTSSYNIGTFLTLDRSFEHMLGFTQTEVNSLMDLIYQDYAFDPSTRKQIDEVIKSQYNGYHFVNTNAEAVYNPTMLMSFLREFCDQKIIPKNLTDLNLRTDLSWVKRITNQPENTEEILTDILKTNTIPYDEEYLISKFNKSQFFNKNYYPISLFYLGMLTRKDEFLLELPNLSMRKIFTEYYNELLHIDVSTRYASMMQEFVNRPDLEKLFADYWRLYIAQFPEAIFSQVNENFYRTTFYELCSRYLSTWFTWNIERSYPKGKTDLEFVGKYHERFAGLRWIIEFKYVSNTEFSKMKCTIENIPLREEDTRQIQGYAQGIRQEYPDATIRLFVIYCIGNQDFRIFEI